MLNAPDFSGFDLAGLEAALIGASIRRDQCLRRAQRIGVPADCPGTTKDIADMDADAAAVAEASRLVAEVRRFYADERSGRPARDNARRSVDPVGDPRPGPFARAMAAISRAVSSDDPRPLSKPPVTRRDLQS